MIGGVCGPVERGTRMAHRRSLGFPGFPVESCGFGRQRVVSLKRTTSVVVVRAVKQKSGTVRDDKKGEGRCKERAVAEPRASLKTNLEGLSSAVHTDCSVESLSWPPFPKSFWEYQAESGPL